ncbi:3-isopropylmalate dehydratase small subunit 1 [Serratia entomophila]|uniref:3-isopropylmalate dehydratase small subunit n=1 Tax=Serratia entomophila TaxID=42906 RepID=UPI0021786C6B|nr:3-isopropylmalate dehydratase small subunit [Serratia entomophila]CAI0811714.1 3-isopropylmalate dehydratase small subunit 1 [Serratia entomophila]CAI1539147.1 3-isopropylmalate dehydratase small subunit 1 [Serratia entomophila]CAI1647019.1 3-isopropylmalate dehydratase small subunit 1 [Serratia entomophila]CAI1821550.1 3-isopropylmalate dehydratase small subunit 1 [Serratia entomophila]CAI2012489.1 3-isopropylmalate dehydratase small subunit 1 [Serratia entomophila]
MPQALNRFQAIACAVMRDNIDTDALIPTSENTRVAVAGYGESLFAFWRYRNLTSRTPDPTFVLNNPAYQSAQILLSGANFGCGSSRESAVWALRDYGFRVIIAKSFNETFLRNCIANGIAPLLADGDVLQRAAETLTAHPGTRLAVELETSKANVLAAPEWRFDFCLDPYYCDLLIQGRTEEETLALYTNDINALRGFLTLTFPNTARER